MISEKFEWQTKDGLPLFAQKWDPRNGEKGVICLVHGLGEHSSRYDHWADLLAKAGYAVVAFDLRGHGRSGGQRGDTPDFNHFAEDISIMLDHGSKLFPGKPKFLYGHSLGGLLVLYHLLQCQPDLKGAIITSPGLHTMLDRQKAKVALARVIGSVFPKVSIPNGLELEGLARDEAVVQAYRKDPLVHDRVSLRMGKGMIEAIEYIFRQASKINIPLLLMHGSADRITYSSGSEKLASLVSGDCTLKLYDGLYHELHNEPEKKEIFKDLKEWLNRHST